MAKRLNMVGLRRMIVTEVRKLREGVDALAVKPLVTAIVNAINPNDMYDDIMELSSDGKLQGADPEEVADMVLQNPRLRKAIVDIAAEVTQDFGRGEPDA